MCIGTTKVVFEPARKPSVAQNGNQARQNQPVLATVHATPSTGSKSDTSVSLDPVYLCDPAVICTGPTSPNTPQCAPDGPSPTSGVRPSTQDEWRPVNWKTASPTSSMCLHYLLSASSSACSQVPKVQSKSKSSISSSCPGSQSCQCLNTAYIIQIFNSISTSE